MLLTIDVHRMTAPVVSTVLFDISSREAAGKRIELSFEYKIVAESCCLWIVGARFREMGNVSCGSVDAANTIFEMLHDPGRDQPLVVRPCVLANR